MTSNALPEILACKDIGTLTLACLPWPQHVLWLKQVDSSARMQLAELINSCNAFMALMLAKLGYFDECAFLTRRIALYQSNIDFQEDWVSILKVSSTDVIDFLLTHWISNMHPARKHYIVGQAICSIPIANLKLICANWDVAESLTNKFMDIAISSRCLERVRVVSQLFPSANGPTNDLDMQQHEFAMKLRYFQNDFGFFDCVLQSRKKHAIFCEILDKGYYELACHVWHSYLDISLCDFIVLHPFPTRMHSFDDKSNDPARLFSGTMIDQTKTKDKDLRYFDHLIQFYLQHDNHGPELYQATTALIENLATNWSDEKLEQLLYSCVIDNCCASVAFLMKQFHLRIRSPFLITNKEMLELIWTLSPNAIQEQILELGQYALSVCSQELWEFLCDKQLLQDFFENDNNALILDFVVSDAPPLFAKTWQQYAISIRQHRLEHLLLHSSQHVLDVLDAQEEVWASDSFCETYFQYLFERHVDNQLVQWLKRTKLQHAIFLNEIEFCPKRLRKFWFAITPNMEKILAQTVNVPTDLAIFCLEQRAIAPDKFLTYLRRNKKTAQEIFDIFASIHFDVDGERWDNL